MPPQFVGMIVAEVRKVFTRASGIAALIIALLVPLLVVGVLCGIVWGLPLVVKEATSADLQKQLGVSVVAVLDWTLTVRNFFVLPLFLLLAAATSVAGEYDTRTLRELTVRPVPRWSILAAKGASLLVLSGCTLVLTMLPALGLGLVVFGVGDPGVVVPADAPGLGDMALAYVATLASDVLLFALAILASLFVRSVGGVVVALTLALGLDKALYLALGVIPSVARNFMNAPQLADLAEAVQPWTLGSALAVWEGYDSAWEPAAFVAVATWSLLLAFGAVVRFHRMDVP